MMQMEYRPKKLWGVLMTEEHMPKVVTITHVLDETPTIKTFAFDELVIIPPGPSCMVCVPDAHDILMAFHAANA